jgi:lysophospholipase L1-like esterase
VSACRLGVLAFGDSITNGGGELQWGVALQSWALWVARGLALPYTGLAVDGARVADVLAEQAPRVPAGTRYDVGCLYVGVNDVRALDWDRAAFERGHRAALAVLRERCDRVLTLTVPLDLGRPPAGAKVHEVNAAIAASAAANEALVVDLSGFGARNLVMADHVHPTAFGQIAIAERALAVLAADGLPAQVRPSGLIRYETTRWRRLRGDLTYAYRHLKVSARAAWDRRRAAGTGRARSGT